MICWMHEIPDVRGATDGVTNERKMEEKCDTTIDDRGGGLWVLREGDRR